MDMIEKNIYFEYKWLITLRPMVINYSTSFIRCVYDLLNISSLSNFFKQSSNNLYNVEFLIYWNLLTAGNMLAKRNSNYKQKYMHQML